jgi:uncharacterized protein
MRWEEGRESENVEDQRGMSGPVMAVGGLGTLVIIILGLIFGADPAQLLRQVQQANPGPAAGGGGENRPLSAEEQQSGKFVSRILADTEDVWTDLFQREGRQYVRPKLVLFSGSTRSACGTADAAVGPFYCPGDQEVYLDTSFFQLMAEQFQSSGDFARAYVIAHEIGHHVQKLRGDSDRIDAARGRASKTEINRLSVQLELQADFYAGVWAYHINKKKPGTLEAGDVDGALKAAKAIGDDALQKKAQGYVVPDSFTHGTSEQRQYWLRKGLETGDVRQGDTSQPR